MEIQYRSSWSTWNNRGKSTSQVNTASTSEVSQHRPEAARTNTTTPTDVIAQSRLARTWALRCYTCGENGHIQSACPNQNRRGLINQDAPLDEEPIYDTYDSDSQQEADTEAIAGDTGANILVLRRNCLLPRSSNESWLRTTLFRSTGTISGKICKIIIDCGSCTNVLSATAIKKLDLKSTAHPSPYKLTWLNKGVDITVSRQVLVSFSIGTYLDTVCCDVVPMDACHLLLCRPWQYDKDTSHHGKANIYSFDFKGRTITLLPSPEQAQEVPATLSPPPTTLKASQTLLLLPKAAFEEELRESDIAWALVSTLTMPPVIFPSPPEFSSLLSSFADVFPPDLRQGLPPYEISSTI